MKEREKKKNFRSVTLQKKEIFVRLADAHKKKERTARSTITVAHKEKEKQRRRKKPDRGRPHYRT